MSASVLCEVVSAILERPVGAAELVPVLCQVRLERMARLLHLRIARMPQAADRELAASLIDALGDQQAQSMLQSPALCEIVRTGRPDAGLLFLLACAGQPGQAVTPRLANGVALERLPVRLANPTAGLQCPAIPSASAQAAAMKTINAALRRLQSAAPFAYAMFSGLVQTLVVRNDSARAQECWGASSGAAIGRVAVINATASKSAAALGEVLLHEATHCAIDCAELVKPLVPLDDPAQHSPSAIVASPWSGNPLTPHAFIHASVVWAVLHEYWSACRSEQDADARLRYIDCGFARLREGRAARLPTLAPHAARVVRLACERVHADSVH